MKACFFANLASTLLASAKASEFIVSSCEDFASVDPGAVSTLTVTSGEIYCDSHTRFPVGTIVTLKANQDLIFVNFAFDVSDSGRLTVEPFVTFTSDGQVQDVDGGALRVSKEAKVTFERSAGFEKFSITGEGPKAKKGGAVFNEGEFTIKGYAYFFSNHAGYGGAMCNHGKVGMSNVFYFQNKATSGGGIYNSGHFIAAGGDVWRNHARTSGGAITNTGRMEFLDDISFGKNAAHEGDGGAIHSSGAVVFAGENTSFTRNYAKGVGGAVANTDGVLTLGTLATFEGNTAGSLGSAVYNDKRSSTEFPEGGGVSFQSSSAGDPGLLADFDSVRVAGGPIYYAFK